MQKQLQGLLSINRNFIVKGTKVQGVENVVHLEWKRKQQICPQCGSKVRNLHQNHGRRKLLREIGSDGKRVYLDVPNLRCGCRSCRKIFTLKAHKEPLAGREQDLICLSRSLIDSSVSHSNR